MNKRTMALTMCMAIGISIGASTKANADFNNGWINTNRGWNYYENGSIKTGWLNYGGSFYYLKDDGNMATKWINVNNNWYYMNDSGSMETGWQKINGNWYFMQESGAMVSNTTIDGYYLGTDGAWAENTSGNETNEGEVNLKDVIMKTEKNTYELGTKEIKVDITNNSKQDVYYGLQYEVEKFENNKWVKVPFKEEPMFIEIAYILEPGKTNSQVISLSNLEELTIGKYRIVKSGGALSAEFEIK